MLQTAKKITEIRKDLKYLLFNNFCPTMAWVLSLTQLPMSTHVIYESDSASDEGAHNVSKVRHTLRYHSNVVATFHGDRHVQGYKYRYDPCQYHSPV